MTEISTTPDCEIVSSRIVNASRELVFRAWADPNHLKNWWARPGFTNTLMNLTSGQAENGVLFTGLIKETMLMNVSL